MAKILLVEDDKSLREIYGIRLMAEGHEIVSAGDGEEALAMAIQERPELILSDIMMPKISGFDMLDILRQTPETANVKVIMMTALSHEEQRQRGEALGADKYLVKSQVGIEDVMNAVREVLGGVSVQFDKPAGAEEVGMDGGQGMSAPEGFSEAVAPVAVPNEVGLPQPVAPFSSPRPANLGENIVGQVGEAPGFTESTQMQPVAPAPEQGFEATPVDQVGMGAQPMEGGFEQQVASVPMIEQPPMQAEVPPITEVQMPPAQEMQAPTQGTTPDSFPQQPPSVQ